MTTLYTCPKCGYAMEDPTVMVGPPREQMLAAIRILTAELAATRAERDALADALWCAEDQWGEDYLWEKWGLSKALSAHRKKALIDAKKGTK